MDAIRTNRHRPGPRQNVRDRSKYGHFTEMIAVLKRKAPPYRARFVNHCDDPPCDLGTFEYQCPACGYICADYATVWWARDAIEAGRPCTFRCERCKVSLVVTWDDDLGEPLVRQETVKVKLYDSNNVFLGSVEVQDTRVPPDAVVWPYDLQPDRTANRTFVHTPGTTDHYRELSPVCATAYESPTGVRITPPEPSEEGGCVAVGCGSEACKKECK